MASSVKGWSFDKSNESITLLDGNALFTQINTSSHQRPAKFERSTSKQNRTKILSKRNDQFVFFGDGLDFPRLLQFNYLHSLFQSPSFSHFCLFLVQILLSTKFSFVLFETLSFFLSFKQKRAFLINHFYYSFSFVFSNK